MKPRPSLLVFGGRGAIGSAVSRRFAETGWCVTATSRSAVETRLDDSCQWIVCDPAFNDPGMTAIELGTPYAAVCWAQGANLSDSVRDVDPAVHLDLYRSNCLFVLQTMRFLLERQLLAPSARLVVVSSIWQRIARQNKLSYIMTKAALGGLVQSASVDLADQGILINAVLPAALATEMTAAQLSAKQIEGLANATYFKRLTPLDAVVGAIEFLCSAQNTGITGQSITVDLGFSHARLV